MKANVTIKALSAAVLGLAGMAFAGSSFAACGTGTPTPDDPSVNWPGGKILVGGAVLGLQGPGMKSSPCLMTANLSANATAAAIVRDNTPANETRYRFRFYLNADGLTTFSGSQQVQVFAANSNAAATTFGGVSTPNILRASLVPGTGVKRVNFVASSGTTSQPATGVNLVAGPNVIEGEIIIGAVGTGKVNLWVNNNTEATPTATITNIDNTSWVGVKFALLGLTNGSSAFRANSAGQNVLFDEFDSRRTTFIGQ